MGHFGRPPIRRAWFLLVLPALVLNYFGPGRAAARATRRPSTTRSTCWSPDVGAAPDGRARDAGDGDRLAGGHLRRVLGDPPGGAARLPAAPAHRPHLGAGDRADLRPGRELGVCVGRRRRWSSGSARPTNLAAAYGIAVTGTLAIDTILFFVVVRLLWNKPRWLAIGGAIAFLIVDLAFFAANSPKIAHGGWFPLAIALAGVHAADDLARGPRAAARAHARPARCRSTCSSTRSPDPPARVPGTAVFLTSTGADTPRALLHNLKHNHVLHEHVVLFTARHRGAPDRAARRAAADHRPRARHHPDRGPSRLPGGGEHPRHARGGPLSRASTSTRRGVVLPQPRHDLGRHEARSGALAEGAVRDAQPECERRGGVLRAPGRPRRRARHPHRALTPAQSSGRTSAANRSTAASSASREIFVMPAWRSRCSASAIASGGPDSGAAGSGRSAKTSGCSQTRTS